MDKPTIDMQISRQRERCEPYPFNSPIDEAILASLEAHKRITESVSEQILQNQLAEADRRAAGRPEPVAWVLPGDDNEDVNGFIPARINRDGEFTKPVYGPDLLAYADRMAAERNRHMGAVQAYIEDAEHLTRQLARETARADAWVKEVRDLARELGIADEDSNGSIHDWRHVKYKLRQLAELQAEHDALVKRLREPVEEYLNINDLWKKSEDDAEGMDLGHPTQAHYFAALLQQAMSAVALDKGGE